MTLESELESQTELKLNEGNNHTNDKVDLKPGEFMLSNVQTLFLNKQMPYGFKLELEEVYLKTADVNNTQFNGKKRKFNVSLKINNFVRICLNPK